MADEPLGWKLFLTTLTRRVQDLVIEFVGTAIALGGIAGTDRLLKWWIGEAKFFGALPVSWAFDLCHLCVMARLVWRIIVPEKHK
jgi:hypothetical protein